MDGGFVLKYFNTIKSPRNLQKAAMAPPPPPPSPPIEEEPTFIEKWERQSKSQSKNSKRVYLEKQCRFPNHIPQSAHCNIDPLLSLISNHIDDHIDDNVSNDTNYRSPMNDMRKVASLCSTYKTAAKQNKQEFQYKRAIQQQIEPIDDDEVPPPPHTSMYTNLSMAENFALAKIHGANYNLCLAKAICPDRTNRLLSCWQRTDINIVKRMHEDGIAGLICLEEKEAVERCIGNGVQKIMKDILG